MRLIEKRMNLLPSLGRKESLGNISKLIGVNLVEESKTFSADIRESYSEFLNLDTNQNKWLVYELEKITSLLRDFQLGAGDLSFRLPYFFHRKSEQDYYIYRFNEALENIALKNKVIFELIFIHLQRVCIFGLEGSVGGSNDGALGIIWANPNPSWLVGDYEDFLVFNLHLQQLLIDARINKHESSSSSNFVHSNNVSINVFHGNGDRYIKTLYGLLCLLSVVRWRQKNKEENSYQCMPNNKKIISLIDSYLDEISEYDYSLRLNQLMSEAKRAKKIFIP